MFTNEHEFDKTVTTILDEEDFVTDIIITYTDDFVILRQYCDFTNQEQEIIITSKMFSELMMSFHCEEGFFKIAE
jgi:hypothetical protein